MVTAVGYLPAFIADAGSYMASALLLLGLPSVVARAGASQTVAGLIKESPAVFVKLWRHPGLRTNLLLALFPVAAFLMGSPNAYGLALNVFDKGATGLAALEVSIACGLIIGGLVISRMALKGDKNAYMFWSFMIMAATYVGIYFSPYFWVAVVLLGIGGIANVGFSRALDHYVPGDQGRRRSGTPDRCAGRWPDGSHRRSVARRVRGRSPRSG